MGSRILSMKVSLLAIAMVCCAVSDVEASECPVAGQQPMLIVRLYFGQDMAGRGPLSARAWRSFLREAVTPRFPDGFTAYDARGQWMNPKTRAVGREATKVVEIAAADTPDLQSKIAALTALYRKRFHQQSVGVVTTPGCGAF